MNPRMANLLLRVRPGVSMRLRVFWLRCLGVRLRGFCWIRRVSIPRNPHDILIEEGMVDDYSVLLTTGEPRPEPRIIIRRGAYINRFVTLDASDRVEIGEYAMIGPYCFITDHDHGTSRDRPIFQQPMDARPVIVGRDAWLGAGVIVLKGVTIGEGAVIGAGSVVTHDVPAFAKMVGVPARQIGER